MQAIYVNGRKQVPVMKGWIFFNTVKHRIEETVHASLDDGYQISSTRWHTLACNKDGVQPELVLTHSHTDNLIYIYKLLAETLHWMNSQTNQADTMGPNLVHSYPNHTKGASSLETGKSAQILGNWLHLSTLSDWRFINLNQSFEQALNLFPRPLVTLSKTQTLVCLVVLTLDQYEITYHPATPLFEHPLGKRCLL